MMAARRGEAVDVSVESRGVLRHCAGDTLGPWPLLGLGWAKRHVHSLGDDGPEARRSPSSWF